MPRYDYRCPSCEAVFELRQGFQDPPVAPCPQCGAESQRLLRLPTVVYKAAGFRTSDSRRGGFGNYWYNREREADERATREARGEVPPGGDSPSAPDSL